jgi:SAM-dependent methyltransferase
VNVDFGKTAADYGRYRAGFPNELFERLAALGIGVPPCAVLDLGTGTGTLGRGFSLRGCDVTGLDPSTALMVEARDATEQLVMRHNPAWKMAGGIGIHGYALADVAIAGFTRIETFSFDVGQVYTPEGGADACARALGSLRVSRPTKWRSSMRSLRICRVWALTATRN